MNAAELHRLRGAIAFARETWLNDGAEGETVHVLCSALERLLQTPSLDRETLRKLVRTPSIDPMTHEELRETLPDPPTAVAWLAGHVHALRMYLEGMDMDREPSAYAHARNQRLFEGHSDAVVRVLPVLVRTFLQGEPGASDALRRCCAILSWPVATREERLNAAMKGLGALQLVTLQIQCDAQEHAAYVAGPLRDTGKPLPTLLGPVAVGHPANCHGQHSDECLLCRKIRAGGVLNPQEEQQRQETLLALQRVDMEALDALGGAWEDYDERDGSPLDVLHAAQEFVRRCAANVPQGLSILQAADMLNMSPAEAEAAIREQRQTSTLSDSMHEVANAARAMGMRTFVLDSPEAVAALPPLDELLGPPAAAPTVSEKLDGSDPETRPYWFLWKTAWTRAHGRDYPIEPDDNRCMLALIKAAQNAARHWKRTGTQDAMDLFSHWTALYLADLGDPKLGLCHSLARFNKRLCSGYGTPWPWPKTTPAAVCADCFRLLPSPHIDGLVYRCAECTAKVVAATGPAGPKAPPTRVIASRADLAAYVDQQFDDLKPEDRAELVARLDTHPNRPRYGEDWHAWLRERSEKEWTTIKQLREIDKAYGGKS